MKTGVFGGTFDPPHVGHLIAAERAIEQAELSRLIFVPAAVPPHKKERRREDGNHRFQMLLRSTRGNPRIEVSDCELQRGGVSYTVDTLREFTATMEGTELCFILGMDMLSDFPSWRSAEEILDLAELLVLTRPDFPLPPVEKSIRRRLRICKIPDIGVSSSDIRRRVREGRSIRYMVRESVEEYIRRHRLYTE